MWNWTALFSNLCDILIGFRLHTGSFSFETVSSVSKWFIKVGPKSIVQHLKGYSCGIGSSNKCLKLVVTFVSLFAWTVWRQTHYKMFPHVKCHTFLILQARNFSGRKSLCESVSFTEFHQIFWFWSWNEWDGFIFKNYNSQLGSRKLKCYVLCK